MLAEYDEESGRQSHASLLFHYHRSSSFLMAPSMPASRVPAGVEFEALNAELQAIRIKLQGQSVNQQKCAHHIRLRY